MTGSLTIEKAGPALSIQDLGRPGMGATGLSRGGALDRMALHEAAALLSLPAPFPAIEMPGIGGNFSTDVPIRFALTGAPMRATLNGRPLVWNAAHRLLPGETLSIGGCEKGTTGYLSPGGKIGTEPFLHSRSAHLTAGIGHFLKSGDVLPLVPDEAPHRPACGMPTDPRFAGGEIRILPGPQSDLFTEKQQESFLQARFHRGPRSNRQAMQLRTEAAPDWHITSGAMASEPIQCGDIQITGDGTPYVLLAECQTIGGYPRIGSVLPVDMGKLVQAAPDAPLHFRPIGWDEAEAAMHARLDWYRRLRRNVSPLVRNPADIPDLLAYQLISGVTDGRELEED